MVCKNCEKENIDENADYCFSCGKKLEKDLIDLNKKAQLSWVDFLIDAKKEYTVLELAKARFEIAYYGLIIILFISSIYSVFDYYKSGSYESLIGSLLLIGLVFISYKINSAILISLFSGIILILEMSILLSNAVYIKKYSIVLIIKVIFLLLSTIQSYQASRIIKTQSKKVALIIVSIIVILIGAIVFEDKINEITEKKEQLNTWEMNWEVYDKWENSTSIKEIQDKTFNLMYGFFKQYYSDKDSNLLAFNTSECVVEEIKKIYIDYRELDKIYLDKVSFSLASIKLANEIEELQVKCATKALR